MASFLERQLRRAGKVLKKVPLAKSVLRAVPGLGTAYAAFDIASDIARATRGGGGVPPMPGAAATMPLPGGPGAPRGMGTRSIFRDDPNVAAYLKQFAIDDRFLKQYFRAPRGFVVLRDVNGDAYGLPKKLAQQYGGWRPAKKPPISVRDWSAMTRARHVMKKLNEVDKAARKLAAFGQGRRRAPIQASYQVITGGKGDDVIVAPPRKRIAA